MMEWLGIRRKIETGTEWTTKEPDADLPIFSGSSAARPNKHPNKKSSTLNFLPLKFFLNLQSYYLREYYFLPPKVEQLT